MRNAQFRVLAYAAYYKAIRDGLLIRPNNCSRCGKRAVVDGHHEDYKRPFDVRWLCRTCHGVTHRSDVAIAIDSRPRCIGCGRVIFKHLLISGKRARVYGPGFVHNACARKADARIAALKASAVA